MQENRIDSASVLWRLLRYAVIDRRTLLLAFTLLGLATLADVAGPYLIKVFLDDYVSKDLWPVNALLLLIALYIGAQLISAVASYRQAILFNTVAVNTVQRLREKLFATILHQPMPFFDRATTGSLVSRITNDTESIKELYTNVIGAIVQSSVRIAGILIAMAIIDRRLMLICLGFVVGVAALMVIYQRLSTPIFSRTRRLLSDINARIYESIQGMRVIQLMNQQSRFAGEFAKVSRQHFRSRKKTLNIDTFLLRPMIDLLFTITLAGLLYVYGQDALTTTVEIGVIYAFVTYLTRFIEPVVEMTQRLSLLQQAVVAASRVFQLADEALPPPQESGQHRITRGEIQLRDVSFAYTADNPVIRKFNLSIPAGQFVALVGHTGSGKSTIASLLMRFYDPVDGQIAIDGQALAAFGTSALYEQMAIVQQDSYIVNGTVLDNIALGTGLPRQQAIEAAQLAHMQEWVARLPNGYDTPLTEKGANLSTGQRQQIALARTLAKRPKILILDEATANVDSHTEHVIQRAILALKGKVTVVMIAHRLSTVKDADRIVVLHRGEVAQIGNHHELLQIDGLYRHLYELQEYHFREL